MVFRELLNLLRPAELPTEERRETMRLLCGVGVLLKVADAMHISTVVNVTLTGLCLELDAPLKPQQNVELTRDDFGEPLRAQVIWCKARRGGKGYRAGLSYSPDQQRLGDSFLKPALRQCGFKAELPGEKRRLIRVPGRVPCELKGLTGESYTDGEMLDLSLGGALVESVVKFNEGLTLAFETAPLGGLPPLQGIAKVASVQQASESGKWRCGLRFTESNSDQVRKYIRSMLRSR